MSKRKTHIKATKAESDTMIARALKNAGTWGYHVDKTRRVTLCGAGVAWIITPDIAKRREDATCKTCRKYAGLLDISPQARIDRALTYMDKVGWSKGDKRAPLTLQAVRKILEDAP